MTRENGTIAVRRKVGGFTALELMAVVFTVMIMAGIVVPVAMRGVRRSRMRSAASQVASGLRRARNLAIASGEVYCARFVPLAPPPVEVKRARVDVYQLKESEIVVTPPVWQTLDDEGRSAGGVMLPAHTTLASLASPTPHELILFLPDGSAWDPGMQVPSGVRVQPSAEYTEYSAEGTPLHNDCWSITVRSLSGRIETEKVVP
jgi:hypothetical protein